MCFCSASSTSARRAPPLQNKTIQSKMSLPRRKGHFFASKHRLRQKTARSDAHHETVSPAGPAGAFLSGRPGDHRPHLRFPVRGARRSVCGAGRRPRQWLRFYSRGRRPGRGGGDVRPTRAGGASRRPDPGPPPGAGAAGSGVLRPPRRRHDPHRRHRHQGQDHHRPHDPGHSHRCRSQNGHDRHPGGLHRRGTAGRGAQHHPGAHPSTGCCGRWRTRGAPTW